MGDSDSCCDGFAEDELASYVLSKPLYQLIMSTSVKNGCKELSKEVGQSVTSTLSTKDDTERQLFNIELSPPSDKENYYSKCSLLIRTQKVCSLRGFRVDLFSKFNILDVLPVKNE